MNRIAEELDAKLNALDPERAAALARMVREALDSVESRSPVKSAPRDENGWPPGYFGETAGAIEGEAFERPPQGTLPQRDAW